MIKDEVSGVSSRCFRGPLGKRWTRGSASNIEKYTRNMDGSQLGALAGGVLILHVSTAVPLRFYYILRDVSFAPSFEICMTYMTHACAIIQLQVIFRSIF